MIYYLAFNIYDIININTLKPNLTIIINSSSSNIYRHFTCDQFNKK